MRYTIRNFNLTEGQIRSVVLFGERKFFPKNTTKDFDYSTLYEGGKVVANKLTRVSLGPGLVNKYLASGLKILEGEHEVYSDILLNRIDRDVFPDPIESPEVVERTLLPTKCRKGETDQINLYFGESRLGNQYIYAIPIPPGIGVAEVYTTDQVSLEEHEQKYYERTGKSRKGQGPVASLYFGPASNVANNPDSRYLPSENVIRDELLSNIDYLKQDAELTSHKILWIISSPKKEPIVNLTTKAWNIQGKPHRGQEINYVGPDFKWNVYNRFDWVKGDFIDRASGTMLGNRVESNKSYKILGKILEGMNNFNLTYKYTPFDIVNYNGVNYRCTSDCIGEYPDTSLCWVLNELTAPDNKEATLILQYSSERISAELISNHLNSQNQAIIKTRDAFIVSGIYYNIKEDSGKVDKSKYSVIRSGDDTAWIVKFNDRPEVTIKNIIFYLVKDESRKSKVTLLDETGFNYTKDTDLEGLNFDVVSIKRGENESEVGSQGFTMELEDEEVVSFKLSISEKYTISTITQEYKGKKNVVVPTRFGEYWIFSTLPLYLGDNKITITKEVRDYNVYLEYDNILDLDVSSYQETTKYGESATFLLHGGPKLNKIVVESDGKTLEFGISTSSYPVNESTPVSMKLGDDRKCLLGIRKVGEKYLYTLEIFRIKKDTKVKVYEDR